MPQRGTLSDSRARNGKPGGFHSRGLWRVATGSTQVKRGQPGTVSDQLIRPASHPAGRRSRSQIVGRKLKGDYIGRGVLRSSAAPD